MRHKGQHYSYQTRVGACADYLLGVDLKVIEDKWKVTGSLVVRWIQKRGCFKIRRSNYDALHNKNNLK